MIVKGGSVGGGGLAAHLKSDENERVDLVSVDGLLSTDIAGAIQEMRALAAGLSAKGLFHFQISPGLGEKWGPEEEARAVALLVAEYGLQGQPMKVVRHAKDAQGVGRDDHLHVVALRTRENGKVISDGFSRVRNEKVSRVLEYELGHRLIPGRHNKAVLARLRAEGRTDVAEWMQQATQVARPEAAKTFSEHQKEKRTGIKKADVAGATLAAWRASDCGAAFAAAMDAQGLRLAKGREGGIMLVDAAGGAHELTRLMRAALKAEGEKVSAADIRAEIAARTADLDVTALPTVAEVSVLAREGAGDSTEPPAAGIAEKGVEVTPESILATITTEKATFTETDLDKAVRGLAADSVARAAIKAAILDRRDVLTLAVDRDGERRMTTLEMAVVEARLLETGEAMAGRADLRVNDAAVEVGLATYATDFRSETGHDLMADQIGAIRHITGGGDFVRVEGVAGAGKSTLLAGAARIWAADNLRVEGCALSGIAASKVAESGIPADTIAAKLLRWDRIDAIRDLRQIGTFTDESRGHVLRALDGWVEAATKRGDDTAPIRAMRSQVEQATTLKDLDRKTRMWLTRWSTRQIAQGLDARTVLVIDECGMVNHRLLDRVMAHAHRAGAKVVAIGDSEQIQPIEAGAAFRVLEKVAPAHRLDTVIRQSEAWMRQATSDLASAVSERAISAVQAYADHGRIHAGIRGVGDPQVMYDEAAQKLGRDLTADDRRHIDTVAAYIDARGEAGGLWREIDAAEGLPEDHPLYGDFKAAQERRNDAAKALAADLGGARPWLARYGVDAKGLAADVAFAEGTHRVLAEELAEERAEAMGLTNMAPDVRMSLDLRGAARQALFADWRASVERDGPEVSRIILAYIHLTDGNTVRDTGDKLTAEAITPKVAEAMALGAVEKGWTEVQLTGSMEEKQTMAKAMVARGVTVLNPEMQRFVNGPECERARALGAEREALTLARQQPNLADPKLFQEAERGYQRALISGTTPEGDLLAMKADVMARGEAVKDAGYSGGETWAQQAGRLSRALPGVALLSVTFDIEHDGRAELKDYAIRHGADGDRWRVVRPTGGGDLRELLDTAGVVVIPDPWGGYQHNAAIHLVDGRGRLVRILDFEPLSALIDEVTPWLAS